MPLEEDDKGTRFTPISKKEKTRFEKTYGRKLRISRHNWQVIYCRELRHDSFPVAGLCNPQNLTIYVDVDCDNPHSTLLHEIFHAECFASGLRQRHDWCMNMEEQLVEMFSESVISLFSLRKKAG